MNRDAQASDDSDAIAESATLDHPGIASELVKETQHRIGSEETESTGARRGHRSSTIDLPATS
jgi:hypothetical protein